MSDEMKDDVRQAEGRSPSQGADSATREAIEHLDDELADRLDVEPNGDIKG